MDSASLTPKINIQGMDNLTGLSIIESCTIVQNNTPSTYQLGTGVYNSGTSDLRTEIRNSIITNNGDASHDIDYAGATSSVVSRGYNLIGYGNAAGAFNQPGDRIGQYLVLRLLADNGGPTQTHALVPGSLANDLAINGGDPSFASPPDFDQRGPGFPRVQGGRVDIGAFETATVAISDAQITEGNSGNTTATFTVTLSAPSPVSVAVDYTMGNSTAKAGADYIAAGSTLVFAPGETTKSITVSVIGDKLDEANEVFFVNLSNFQNAVISDAQGRCTIIDDDNMPALTISPVSTTEGDGGTKTIDFTLALSAPSGLSISVDYATADATAFSTRDYVAQNGVLTFTPGQTSKTISITINGDTLNEADEKFYVNLTNAKNVNLLRTRSAGTILNDDALPTVTVNDVTVVEGHSGTKNIIFTLGLSAPTGRVVTVNYSTADGTASADSDYSAKNGSVIFTVGQTTATIRVVVNGDKANEADEMFFLNLLNPVNATLSRGQGTGTITNDDASG